jgi:hypothetical protein
LQKSERAKPRPYNAAVVTNFVHHYGAPKKSTPGSWSVFYVPPKTTVQPPDAGAYEAIQESLRNHGHDVPEEI